jgi:hypothetical protein
MKITYLCRPFDARVFLRVAFTSGIVAERLGTGLQNLLQRFESARYLHKKQFAVTQCMRCGVFCFGGKKQTLGFLPAGLLYLKGYYDGLKQ